MLETESSMVATKPQTTASTNSEKPNNGVILVVEDEQDLLSLLTYHLQRENFTVIPAINGKIACEIIEKNDLDVVLLDILIPELDGWEVCKTIRGHSDILVSSVPVIMMTALRSEKDKLKGLELGADAFITKPYSLKEVILHCHNFIQIRHKYLSLLQETNIEFMAPKKSICQLLLHELGNHLTIIGGMSSLLCRSANLDHKEAGFSTTILKSARYLEMIVNDTQLFEQIKDKNLDIPCENFDLNVMIIDIIEMLRPAAEDKQIEVVFANSKNLNAVNLYKSALKIIMATIFENSLKYCPIGSKVYISANRENKKIEIAITDNGPGIEEKEQEKIFNINYRARGETQNKPGSGLGLYFAKILTEVMDGTITVNSSLGRGSTFTISFNEKETSRPDTLLNIPHVELLTRY